MYRKYRNRLVAFLVLVLPVLGMALLHGLDRVDDDVVHTGITIFFVLNVLYIALRMFAFGFRRYFDLARYPNPPCTTAAINKYVSRFGQAQAQVQGCDLGTIFVFPNRYLTANLRCLVVVCLLAMA